MTKYVSTNIPIPPDASEQQNVLDSERRIIYVGFPRPLGVSYPGADTLQLQRAEIDHRFKRGDR